MSAVIRLTRKEVENLPEYDHKLFRRVVKQAFSQRRKMLRNTMKVFIPHEILMEDDYFTIRPEKLSVDDFIVLTNKVDIWMRENPTT